MRKSALIRRQQATNFAPAIRLAEKTGRPLNLWVTINYSDTACPPERVSAAFARLRDNHFTPWYRRPRKGLPRPVQPAAFIWVIEDTGVIGVHWLLHLPVNRRADFAQALPKWLAKTTGGVRFEENAIHIDKADTPFGARKYMLKALDPLYGPFYGIKTSDQGEIYGKRCGFSASLGPSRCRAARTYHRQMMQDLAANKAAA